MRSIRLLLVDDDAVSRARLQRLLENAGDIRVVGQAENERQAVLEAKALRPDVVLLDLAMLVPNGVEAVRQIAHEVPSTRVIMLSSYCDRQHVQPAAEAAVAGYLLKEVARDDLLKAVHTVCAGGVFFSSPVLKLLKHHQKRRVDGPRSLASTVHTVSVNASPAIDRRRIPGKLLPCSAPAERQWKNIGRIL